MILDAPQDSKKAVVRMPAKLTVTSESLRERMFILESRLINIHLLLQHAVLDERQRRLLARILSETETEVELVFRERIANEHWGKAKKVRSFP